WEGTKPPPQDVVNGMTWELFDLSRDPTQNHNLASANPAKLKELQDMFWVEAKKYEVLPLDASALTRFITPRPSITAGRDKFVYSYPLVGTPQSTAPNILNRSFTITADIDVPEGGAEGMLVTAGGGLGVWGFYGLKAKPVFVYNLLDLGRPKVAAPNALPPGKHVVE